MTYAICSEYARVVLRHYVDVSLVFLVCGVLGIFWVRSMVGLRRDRQVPMATTPGTVWTAGPSP